jgi:peptide/nickel transport system substrate-binding protein
LRAITIDPKSPVNLRIFGWCVPWPSGELWVRTLFSQYWREDGNLSQFHEDDVNDEIEQISELPLAEQPAAWGALEARIRTDYHPGFVRGYGGSAHIHGSKIGGMSHDEVNGMPTWKDIFVMP